jgi:hypothetical protein
MDLRADVDGMFTRCQMESDCIDLIQDFSMLYRRMITAYLRKLEVKEHEANDGVRVNLETLTQEQIEGLNHFIRALVLLNNIDSY